MTTIRIYNDPKYKRRQISVLELKKEYFSENVSLQDANIGFIGASNQKSFVNTSPQVYVAYNSRFLHKHNELGLFIERHKKEASDKEIL